MLEGRHVRPWPCCKRCNSTTAACHEPTPQHGQGKRRIVQQLHNRPASEGRGARSHSSSLQAGRKSTRLQPAVVLQPTSKYVASRQCTQYYTGHCKACCPYQLRQAVHCCILMAQAGGRWTALNTRVNGHRPASILRACSKKQNSARDPEHGGPGYMLCTRLQCSICRLAKGKKRTSCPMHDVVGVAPPAQVDAGQTVRIAQNHIQQEQATKVFK